jgi:hypothetical protein
VNALGGKGAVSDLAMLQVRRCAELQTMCEMARASMLNGAPTDMLALVRLEGACVRALRVLGLKVEPPPAKASGGLALARARWAEQAERERKAKGLGTTDPTDPKTPGASND